VSGRAVAVTVSVVLVLGAGVVVADRVAASMAERRAVEAVQENLDVTGTPSLSIEGFPFLTQVLAGSLDEVSGSVDGVTLDGGITATDVTFDAQGVQTSEPYTVSTGTVSATLPTATLEQVVAEQTDLDVDVSVEGERLVASGAVLGVDLSAALTPRVEDGRLLVDVGQMSLGGLTITVDDLPDRIASRLTDLEVPVSGLPEGLTLTSVAVVPDGARITATGQDVTLAVAP
jgi:hypothetical protein